MIRRHIAINGELGSGKSSVARRLAERHGMRLVSTGDVQRAIAESLSMTTLETNLLAERDAMIDARVDGVTKELGSSQEPIVFDSRMAWKMVPTSFRVRLIVDRDVAAERLFRERSSTVEGYISVKDARRAAEERYQSESKRFFAKYGADISHLQNYHLVVDTSDTTVDAVVAIIESLYMTAEPSRLELRVSPKRVLPGYDPRAEIRSNRREAATELSIPSSKPGSDPTVAYVRPFIYALEGQSTIGLAIKDGQPLVKAVLLAEGAESVAKGLSAEEYLHRVIRPSWITAWEEEYGVRFSNYPTTSCPIE